MYVIKMSSANDKSLTATIKSNIYQGERNADTLVFLLPMYSEDTNLADCTVLLRYILPGGTGKSEELEMDAESYDDYYRYRLKVGSKFTKVTGRIELWLSAIDMSNNFIFKSGSVMVEIKPTKNITDYMDEEDLDQLDKLALDVQNLKTEKADGIEYDEENHSLQLTSNNAPVGDKCYLFPDSTMLIEVITPEQYKKIYGKDYEK